MFHLADREGVPVAVAVVKATFSIRPDSLVLSEMQQPVLQDGIPYGEPGKSSYRYEPEAAYFKPATDVVLIAAATPPGGMAERVDVEFSVGSLRKRARVFGDRYWYRSFTGPEVTPPDAFREMPLLYERSF